MLKTINLWNNSQRKIWESIIQKNYRINDYRPLLGNISWLYEGYRCNSPSIWCNSITISQWKRWRHERLFKPYYDRVKYLPKSLLVQKVNWMEAEKMILFNKAYSYWSFIFWGFFPSGFFLLLFWWWISIWQFFIWIIF